LSLSQMEAGSPPRVRGTDCPQTRSARLSRITPACAGNSQRQPASVSVPTDHPRVCGEQLKLHPKIFPLSGSPPRVRGTARIRMQKGDISGITPACAGNRGRPSCGARGGRDHPRVCGEQRESNALLCQIIGSPPRVRGTAVTIPRGRAAPRITPACAGNSSIVHTIQDACRDHPRVCGEQYTVEKFRQTYPGSPPRVRGTVLDIAGFGGSSRITPACAGNSRHRLFSFWAHWDHPRVCGEQAVVQSS